MPGQLLSESREYLKVLDLITRYLKNGNGNLYLRRGTARDTGSRFKSPP